MSASVTVGLLHPGRMGAAVAAQLMANGHTVLWCPDGRSPATHRRAEDAGLSPAPLEQLLADSEIVLSICPPAVAEEIATTVAEIEYRGIYVEANAISPARMHRIAARFTEAEAAVVDGCFVGSPPGGHPPLGSTSPEPRPRAVGLRTCSPAPWSNLSCSGSSRARPAP